MDHIMDPDSTTHVASRRAAKAMAELDDMDSEEEEEEDSETWIEKGKPQDGAPKLCLLVFKHPSYFYIYIYTFLDF